MKLKPFLILAALALVLAGAIGFDGRAARAHESGPVAGEVPGETLGTTSDADFWRAIRQGEAATVSIPDRQAAVLIQSEGETWRNLRNGPISLFGGWLLLGIVIVIGVYFAVRGRIRIDGGRSGRTVQRFTQWQRISHWFAAALFVLLGSTGLVMLFGRYALKPVLGAEAFAAIASASLQAHNLFGPMFIIAVVWLFVFFLKGNFFSRVDIGWIVRLGGFFGGHASSGFYNFAEKNWFWMAVTLGALLSASGIVLDFPTLLEDRQAQQLAHLGHAVAAIVFIAVGLGHIYLGAIGVEGALEAMTRGDVDVNWAKSHHDLWYEDVVGKDAAKAGGE